VNKYLKTNKAMKKFILSGGVMSVIMGVCMITVSLIISNTTHEVQSEYGSNIGNKYVLFGDTLVIVDYSILESTYTLSNGVKISKELVSKK
jgi:hypothetical protein